MKLKTTLLGMTLAAFTAVATTALAAEVGKHEAAAAGQDAAQEPMKKPMKKHNHVEEKTNMPMPEAAPDKDKEMQKDRHDHMKEKH